MRSSMAWQRPSGPRCTGRAGSASVSQVPPGPVPAGGVAGGAHGHSGRQVQQFPGRHRAVGRIAQRIHQRAAVGGRGDVDIDKDQVPVAEQLAAAAVDLGIYARRPRQALPAGWTLCLVSRRDRHAFEILPRRWVVERTFAWISKHRRTVRDYEHLPPATKPLSCGP